MAIATADGPSTMMLNVHSIASSIVGVDPWADATSITKHSCQNDVAVDSYVIFVRSCSETET